jgi:hypothetical protein
MPQLAAQPSLTVIFLHLPKTAGTTLHTIINRQYPREAIHAFGPDAVAAVAAFKSMPEVERTKIRLLQGHMPFGLHAYLPQPAAYFTMLRHPVERMISEYYYARNSPVHYLYPLVTGQNLSLQQAIEGQVHVMLNDAQTRLLSGVWGEVPFGEMTAMHLEQAKHNLAHCAVVGLTERFDESLLLLQRAFGWQNIRYQRVNVTPERPKIKSLDPATLTAICQAHPLDLALYDYAQQLFAEQKKKYRLSFWHIQAYYLGKWLAPLYWRARQYSLRHALRRLGQ